MNCLIQGNIDLPTNEVKADINTVNACRPRTLRPDRYGHERQTRSCRENAGTIAIEPIGTQEPLF